MTQCVAVVAYLGPEGTYSHQAVLERFENRDVIYQARKTINDTFGALSEDGPAETRFAFVPWENSIQGQVLDTYDALRQEHVGQSAFVRGEHTIRVEHCLVVQKGTRIEDVRRVMSHEQALGQCKMYLQNHLPNATLVRVASTAGAAKTVAETHGRCTDAAVCARICADLYPGLEVIAAGIQDVKSNATRFMVLASDATASLPASRGVERWRGLIRARVSAAAGRMLGEVAAGGEMYIRQVDRRPTLCGVGHEYFVEVEAEGKYSPAAWEAAVSAAAARMHGTVLGIWE